jgi:hypothetical protein
MLEWGQRSGLSVEVKSTLVQLIDLTEPEIIVEV